MYALPTGILFATLMTAAPIFVVLGLTAMALYAFEGLPLQTTASLFLAKLNSPTLLAVPFFVLAAAFMQSGGIVKTLIEIAEVWVGRIRGGLAIVCVLATTLFAAISGSSVATAMAMGRALVPVMKTRGYPDSFAVGTIAAAGTLGVLIPPSLGMILYGVIAEESVLRLFLAGVLPGLLQATIFIIWILIYARRHNLARTDGVSGRTFVVRHVRGFPALLIPFIIFVGIFGGFLSVSEAAAFSAIAAIAVAFAVYRTFAVRDFPDICVSGMRSTAAILLIVASAFMLSHWLTHTGMPNRLLSLLTELELAGWQFLLLMNVIMLLLGMFLDATAVILITVPMVAEILEPMGISSVHYAVVVTVNMEIGALTPPIGLNLFVLAAISGLPLRQVIAGVLPFVVLMLGLLMVITYVPEISTWLPDLVLGAR